MAFHVIGTGSGGSGLVYPDSASRPFASNSARNTWANNNKSDLIKDTTVVNVGGTQWYLWIGQSNPQTVDSSLWMDASQIVNGDKGDSGTSITTVSVNSSDELIIDKDDGTSTNVGRVTGLSAYEQWLAAGNTGTEQDYLDSLKGDKGDDGAITATADTNELLKVDSNGNVVGTGVYSDKDGSAKFGSGSIDIGHHTISSAGEGVEATNASTGESYSFVFAGQGDDTGPVHRVIEPTQIDLETTTDKSKQLTNHISRVTAFDDFRLIREPITIEAVSAQTNVTMQVRSLNGEDIWSYGPFNMQSGVNLITPDTILDFKVGQYDVEFTSPDGDVTLVGGVSPITGFDIFYGILPTKLFTDETLHNIKHGADIVRTIEAGSNVTLTTDADGKLTISSTASGGGSGSTLDVDGNETEIIETGTGVTSSYDAGTKTTTLTVDPTNIDLSDYAKLNEANEFTVTQTIKDADLHVTKADDSELFTVKQNIDTAEVKGTLLAQDVKSTVVDSGQNSNLLLKHNGVSKVFVSATGVTIQDSLQLNNGATTATSNITQDTSLTNKEYVDDGDIYRGEGLAAQAEVSVVSTTQTQTEPVTRFVHGWANSSPTSITVDDTNLAAAESIIYLPADAGPGSVTYTVTFGANSAAKSVRRGETWKATSNSVGVNWERVDSGMVVARGMGDRDVEIVEPAIKLFQYAENMPYHLLIETPGAFTDTGNHRARLIHEFPKEKTFVFSPNATDRTYNDSIVVNETNQGVASADLDLGEYDDFPLYVMEPNVVINRDQRASINFPANMTIDVSNGFYVFGTMSGWCGNNRTSGTANVYVGSQDNTRSPFGAIGLRIADDGLYIMDGTSTATEADGSYEQIKFQRDDGLTNFYRFAFFVDSSGLMTYYVLSLNSGHFSTGSHQCTLGNVGSNPKLWMTYDRLSNNTAAIALAETYLVLNTNSSSAEGRWNWRF